MPRVSALLRKTSAIRRRLGLVRSKPLSQYPELLAKIDSQATSRQKWNALPNLDHARVIELRDHGQSNWIIIAEPGTAVRARFVIFPNASGNVVVLGKNSQQPQEVRFEGSDNIALCGDGIKWAQISMRFVSNKALVCLGHGSIYNGTSIIVEGDGCGVEIGRNALFAPGTTIRTSDLHGIYDLETGEWLNRPKAVVIEPHTWFGQDVLLLKGSHVGGGSVVAAKALVNSELPQFCVAAGSPAQPVKRGVCWSMGRQPEPSQLQSIKDMLQEFAKIEETNVSL